MTRDADTALESAVVGYRQLVQHSMSAEAFAAFQLAFLRPFAVPHMADLPLGAGQITADAELRAYRTGLQMYEIIAGGFDSQRARTVLSHINRAHAVHHIPSDDFDYVLDAFVVVPLRHMERWGWRRPTLVEQHATVEFYRALGRRLTIRDLPKTYREIERRFDAYEAANVRRSDSTAALGRLTLKVLQRRLPQVVRQHAPLLFSTQLGDDRVADALGMPPASPTLQTLLRPALRAHGAITAVRHRRRPFFTPGQPARPFPQGYELHDLL
ncbi:oxygenase MpaB family protein [Calidifontibacter indicus]|uniref:oxygenase MpaB family protein n=1 Tax=Calidifontibacter indicus TaxID=419650 RepID=UPI003D72874D